MASPAEPGFWQGAALPDVKTTTATQTTAPAWYNNFLSGLAGSGQNAFEQGGVAGFSGLQNQVFGAAPQAVQAGQGALGTAVSTATDVAGTPTIGMINQYMNPYTEQVVGEIGRLGQQNWENKIAPGATAGAVGSGQFGSTRGMNVYGNLAREVNRDITGQQGTLLQSGFNDALKAAQAQQTLDLQAAQQLGQLSGQQYTQGTGGLDVLSKLGAQQQALEQAKLNYPMSALGQVSNLIKGYTVPTSVTQSYTGPMPNAYAKSPAELMGGLATGAGGFFAPGASGQPSPYQNIKSAVSSIPGLDKIFGNMGPVDSTTGNVMGTGYEYEKSTPDGGWVDASGIYYPPGTATDAFGKYIGDKTGVGVGDVSWDSPVYFNNGETGDNADSGLQNPVTPSTNDDGSGYYE
jgi:hypothetical protein